MAGGATIREAIAADLTFIPVQRRGHWNAYHELRKHELFGVYSPGVIYRRDDPDEFRPGRLPHVLICDGTVIGTLRIDLITGGGAGFRLIAVAPGLRSKGFGGWMLARAEGIASAYGRRRFVINASPRAVAFYERHGYATGEWWDERALNPDLVRLGKDLDA